MVELRRNTASDEALPPPLLRFRLPFATDFPILLP
jgi:hypothetical protein